MATDFEKCMFELASVEHENDSTRVLHKNPTENGLTFFGIYQSANPKLKLWTMINEYLTIEPNPKKCGNLLLHDKNIMAEVYSFYKTTYWDFMKLDQVNDYHKKLEIFIFAVNVWRSNAIKELQKLLGFTGKNVDGVVGAQTLARLNAYDSHKFDSDFDEIEIAYYEKLGKPMFEKGWVKRAKKY